MNAKRKSHGPVLSKSRFDAVIFDLDGVVTQTETLHAAAWKEAFDDFLTKCGKDKPFVTFDAEGDYRTYVDGKPRLDGVRSFLLSRGIELPEGHPDDGPGTPSVCGIGNQKNQIFRQMIKKGVKTYASSIEMIVRLRKRGFKTAVVSSSKNCPVILESADIVHLFDAKVDGIDLGTLDLRGKPEPDLFLEAAKRLGTDPVRSVVVEDAIAGVQAGRNGGFGMVIGVDRFDQAEALKTAGADWVVGDLAEITVEVTIADLPPAFASKEKIYERMKDKDTVLLLDYDGTLTPIVSHPQDAWLGEEMRETLLKLANWCTVAVISGRGLEDVRKRVAIDGIYYAGSHGFEIEGPGIKMEHENALTFVPLLDELEADLRDVLASVDGALVERKRFSIALHYRNVSEADAPLVEAAADKAVKSAPRLRKTYGKMVYELQPDIDWNKGRAVEWLLDVLEVGEKDTAVFYLGDDVTDEDALEAVKDFGTGIVVGEGDRKTAAHYRLADVEEVRDFLNWTAFNIQEGNTWSLVYEGFSPHEEKLREALCTLGNGYFATRGAMVNAFANTIHYPGTYLAGGYDRLKTEIAGEVVKNEDLVNMPNWLLLSFRFDGGDWIDPGQVEIRFYRQELDMKRGILHRVIRFADDTGRITRLLERRLVHMGQRHMAALEVVLSPVNWSGKIEVRSALDGNVRNEGVERYEGLSNRHLEMLHAKEIDESTILLKVRTVQSKLVVAQAARTMLLRDNEPAAFEKSYTEEKACAAQVFATELSKGERLTIEKVVSVFTSRDHAISECALEAKLAVDDAGRFSGLATSHALEWKQAWRRFEIELGLENPQENYYTQRVVRLYAFHLLQTASKHTIDLDVGMPARGWHGEAYRGHIFWDELIIFPFLNYRIPQITRSLILYRYRRLPEARRAAKALGYRGAMYPWQSGSNGTEESQRVHFNPVSNRWIPDHSRLQRHISSAIAHNIWQYYQVTGDLEFLTFYGAEMLLEIARFWGSIATYNKELDRYEILGVMGPDEYHDGFPGAEKPGVDNNAYTNIMAVYVISKALQLPKLLPREYFSELCEKLLVEKAEIERLEEISRKMRVVFHGEGIISQFEGYDDLEEFDWEGYRASHKNIRRLDRILEAEGDTPNRYKVSKQADVLMLFYLFSAEELSELFAQLGYDLAPETIAKNIEYYTDRTSNGSSLSRVVHSWVSMRINREVSWEQFLKALKVDIADIQEGTTPEGIHLGAMAGCTDILQRCYTGLEARGDTLILNPVLPKELKKIKLHLHYRGQWLDLAVSSDKLRIHALPSGAEPIKINVKGKDVMLEIGETKVITY
jgi:alpha,alpha-trehalase